MRDVAVVAFARSRARPPRAGRNEVEMLMPVLHRVKSDLGIDQSDIDFTCSGSTDYLAGSAFSFVMTLDGVGASPPISESHVEMDGAWALYEAWVKIQTGAADTALVARLRQVVASVLRDVLSRQLDPYYQGLVARQPGAGGPAGPGLPRRRGHDGGGWPPSPPAAGLAAAANPFAAVAGLGRPRVAAEGTRDRRAAPAATAADHRQRRRVVLAAGVGPRAERQPGVRSGASTTASRPTPSACATSHDVGVDRPCG